MGVWTLGWKIVRDRHDLNPDGISGQWRVSADPVTGLARKLVEESVEFMESRDPDELYDLRDVLMELIGLLDPEGQVDRAHEEKILRYGLFGRHVEWTPMPTGELGQRPV